MRYHPTHACAWCGNRQTGELKPTVHKDTRAPALMCLDPVACVRRQMRTKLGRAA